MKVYNISDSREFFEKLTACRGTVELVDEKGARLPIPKAPLSSDPGLMTCFRGTIREMELRFQDPEDMDKILHYLMNKRNLAA